MAPKGSVALASLACLAAASPFDPHQLPGQGPYFEGWFTRITDAANRRSIAVIAGSFQPSNASALTTSWVAAIVAQPDGSVLTEQVFPEQDSVSITQGGSPAIRPPEQGRPAEFEWTSSVGSIAVTPDGASALRFRFPSGLSIDMDLASRVPWDPSCPEDCGPEGWVGKLPPSLLPTHYFVHTLASSASYTVNGDVGKGFAHQETNYGARFPTAWTWLQGVAADGKTQLLMTGGEFTVAGVTVRQFLLGYRSATRQWDFRGIDLDPIDAEVDGCKNSLRLTARTPTGLRRLELEASAPAGSYCEPLYFPTATGWSNQPGSVESYVATVTVRLFEGLSQDPVEQVQLDQVALEFGGTYICQPTTAQGPEPATASAAGAVVV